MESSISKQLNDLNSVINLNDKKFNEFYNQLSISIEKLNKDHNVESEYIEKKINSKVDVFKVSLEEFKRKLVSMFNLQFEAIHDKYNDNQKLVLKEISEKLENKVKYLKEDLELDQNNYKTLLEGKLSGKIIEKEREINEKFEKKINEIQ